ncbi:DUF3450 domain-containing protein [Desulfonatronum parangueonense]
MMIRNNNPTRFSRAWLAALGWCLLLPLWTSSLIASDQVSRVIETEQGILRQGQESQTRIDAMADETLKLVHEYRNLMREQENLAVYNDNLEEMIRSQEAEKDSLKRQIEEIKVTQREIVPLMLRMVDGLEGFVAADLPFLLEERLARVEGLRALMRRADVDVPEKFRQIMHAYQTEADYGRTIEAYQGELVTDNGIERSVEFLRIGRLVLAYQTLDRGESGFWDARNQAWTPLETRHNQSIRQGLRIAARQTAPELIQVPVMVSEPVAPGFSLITELEESEVGIVSESESEDGDGEHPETASGTDVEVAS